MRRKAYTVSENYIWVTKGVVQKLLSDRKTGGRGWNFSHLRFSYAKKDLIKFLNFIIKKKQITSPLHGCCTQLLVKRVLSNGFSFLSGTFFSWTAPKLQCFQKIYIELFLTMYWGIWKTKTLMKVFDVWCLVAGGTVVACDFIGVLFWMLPSTWLTYSSIGWFEFQL